MATSATQSSVSYSNATLQSFLDRIVLATQNLMVARVTIDMRVHEGAPILILFGAPMDSHVLVAALVQKPFQYAAARTLGGSYLPRSSRRAAADGDVKSKVAPAHSLGRLSDDASTMKSSPA